LARTWVGGAGTAALEGEQEERAAAHKPGRHGECIDEHNQGMLMGYSSFTRLRAVRCHGD